MKQQLKHITSITLSLAVSLVGPVFGQGGTQVDSFVNFTVQPAMPYVDSLSSYHLTFSLSSETYGRLHNSQMVFEFPSGFGLNSVDSVSIESDHPVRQYRVDRISVDNDRLILRLKRSGGDRYEPIEPRVNFDIGIFAVQNPSIGGHFQLTATAIRHNDLMAGPSLSDTFQIVEPLVGPKPELQIISTELIAPNSPKVNTGQAFTVLTRVANNSGIDAQRVLIEMTSDGQSVFDTLEGFEVIMAGDTVQAIFEVVAASDSGTENFSTDIASNNIIELDPIDNLATAIIQVPAQLDLTSSVADGATVNLTDHQAFTVTFELVNLGEASVSPGHYTLTITGNEINNEPLVLEGEILVGHPIQYVYMPTKTGRAVVVNFRVDQLPLDSNSLQLAPIIDEEIEFTIIESAAFPNGFKDSFIVENNPFNPNNGPVTFVYNLDANSDVEFRIFTVTGEEVHSDKFIFGNQGGQTGINQIQWDGRNEAGKIVLNGVYVTMLNFLATGETATLKLAVLK